MRMTIKEVKRGKESIFICKEYLNDILIDRKEIMISSAMVEYEKKQHYLLYDSSFKVISKAYLFLNHNIKDISVNTRINYFYGLKYLYIFSEVIDKPIEQFQFNDFHKLNAFLKGVSAEGKDLELHLLTKRCNSTINGFFSIYREFYRFLKLNDSELFLEHSMSKYIPNVRYTGKNRKINEVPKYISREKFAEIMNYLKSSEKTEYSIRDQCIVRLMFFGGLRLGETLGLTLEDFEFSRSKSGNEHCLVIIRNRFSDKPYQNAKTCMNIHNTSSYKVDDYKTIDTGYQKAVLLDLDGVDTYDLICEYIDIAHDRVAKKRGKYYKETIADAVGSFKMMNKENHYLFMNSRGTRLSDVSWNEVVRKIFNDVGIPIDYGVKKNNLSHRFRHGFCMFLMHDLNMMKSKVKIFSRHANDSSLNTYNNPGSDDIIKFKEEIQEKALDIQVLMEVIHNDKKI